MFLKKKKKVNTRNVYTVIFFKWITLLLTKAIFIIICISIADYLNPTTNTFDISNIHTICGILN